MAQHLAASEERRVCSAAAENIVSSAEKCEKVQKTRPPGKTPKKKRAGLRLI
jgi:hypothetical protein